MLVDTIKLKAERERRNMQCSIAPRRWRSSVRGAENARRLSGAQVIWRMLKSVADMELGSGPVRFVSRIVLMLSILISTAFFSYAAWLSPGQTKQPSSFKMKHRFISPPAALSKTRVIRRLDDVTN